MIPTFHLSSWQHRSAGRKNYQTWQTSRYLGPQQLDPADTEYNLHVFCDASEQVYGSVAYLVMESTGKVHVTFMIADSRVVPRQQLSMPQLELCAALTGAHSLVLAEIHLLPFQDFCWHRGRRDTGVNKPQRLKIR